MSSIVPSDEHSFSLTECDKPQLGHEMLKRRKRIAMVSDFFYPNTGGVEHHLYQLSTCLIKSGNKVIIITHSYGKRKGIRYLTNGIKVYYIPQNQIYNQSSMPTICFSLYFPTLRHILIREQIDIVHSHQAFSTMALEGLFLARTMGYKTCFTDHSLFGFADASSIHTNKILKFCLSDAGHVICVSYTSKENTVLRASLDPVDVSVIPNAFDPTKFTPKGMDEKGVILKREPPNKSSVITIVTVSRLVYRKGVDLIAEIIPRICHLFPNVHFIIGGDGPRFIDLEEVIEKHQLQDRVELLGAVKHSDVRDVLIRGDIFLNCSLTEAFCIAIVEAASCGLLVVSTSVGGVPEVLPPHILKLAPPTADDLIDKLQETIHLVKSVDRYKIHEEVKEMYSWFDVSQRTEVVYDRLLEEENIPLIERLRSFYGCGLWAGKIFCVVVAIGYLVWQFYEWLLPREEIEIARDITEMYKKKMEQRKSKGSNYDHNVIYLNHKNNITKRNRHHKGNK